MKSRILIIIDMINDFVKEGGALYFKEGEAIIPAIKKRIDEYGKHGLTVIFFERSTLEIAGVCTSICIMDTAGAAVNRGFKVEVNTNCVADFDPDNHTGALNRMQYIYGIKLI